MINVFAHGGTTGCTTHEDRCIAFERKDWIN